MKVVYDDRWQEVAHHTIEDGRLDKGMLDCTAVRNLKVVGDVLSYLGSIQKSAAAVRSRWFDSGPNCI